MLTAEQNRKLAKTQVSDKVKCVKASVYLPPVLYSLRETDVNWYGGEQYLGQSPNQMFMWAIKG